MYPRTQAKGKRHMTAGVLHDLQRQTTDPDAWMHFSALAATRAGADSWVGLGSPRLFGRAQSIGCAVPSSSACSAACCTTANTATGDNTVERRRASGVGMYGTTCSVPRAREECIALRACEPALACPSSHDSSRCPLCLPPSTRCSLARSLHSGSCSSTSRFCGVIYDLMAIWTHKVFRGDNNDV